MSSSRLSFSEKKSDPLPPPPRSYLADFVTNNQILVLKIIKIRPPSLFFRLRPLIRFYEFFRPLTARLLRPPHLFGA